MTANTLSSKQSLKPLFTTGRYFKQKFGLSVYKIPVSIMGFTCPNIDGKVAKGGCVFCENESFSPNLGVVNLPKKFRLNQNCENIYLDNQIDQLKEQVVKTRNKLIHKFDAKRFLVYFQSFTNTYAPFETLKSLYEEALAFEGVVGLSIGTRTDAITDELLDYLENLAKNNEIWLEYGVQSCYDETLKRINRGHGFDNIVRGIKRTKNRGIKICAHLIFGLPGEDEKMMLKSVEKTVDLGIDAIKIHPLYVTKRTALAHQYTKGVFTPIEEDQYLEILMKALKIIPKDIVIQRLMAGTDDGTLLAPSWCKNLKKQRKQLRQRLEKEGYTY